MIFIRWLKKDIDKNEIDDKRGEKLRQKVTVETVVLAKLYRN